MHLFKFASKSEQETKRLGDALGRIVPPGIVLGLNGTLGSGKTRLTQAIGSGLGIAEGNIVSPTFTLATPHQGRLLLLHLDAYRIKSDEEVDEFGLDELVEDGAFLVVEWAERIERLLPPVDINCRICILSDDVREFQFSAISIRGKALLDQLQQTLSANNGEHGADG